MTIEVNGKIPISIVVDQAVIHLVIIISLAKKIAFTIQYRFPIILGLLFEKYAFYFVKDKYAHSFPDSKVEKYLCFKRHQLELS